MYIHDNPAPQRGNWASWSVSLGAAMRRQTPADQSGRDFYHDWSLKEMKPLYEQYRPSRFDDVKTPKPQEFVEALREQADEQ